MIIGITGSIGSGKTTAAKIFSKLHFSRIDADEIGHHILKRNSVAYRKIIKIFGNGILDKNRDIARKKLSDIVFNDKKSLEKLNSITHLIIINEIKNQIKKIQKKCGGRAGIIIDAPLLLETKTVTFVDKVIVVECSKENILKRLSKKYSMGEIEKILNAQMPLDEKLRHADFVIDNNKDLKHLEKQVKNTIKNIEK